MPALLERLGIRITERRGNRLWALCPNPTHDDHDPSWQILDDLGEPDHGRHHCFGCGFGGYPSHLVSAVLELSLRDARRWVREGASAPAPTKIRVETLSVRRRRFVLPNGIRFEPLDEWPTPARRYLLDDRHITPAQVIRWGIGYGFAGKLAGRLVFPVRETSGVPVGYFARTFTGRSRRYLTPDRHENASVNAVYGEQHWPDQSARNTVVATEGGIDALAVERAVRVPIGAVLGSEPSPGQILRLSTFRRVLIATDGDSAGEKVAGVLWAALKRWTEVERIPIPEGEDCDSLPGRELRRLLSCFGLGEPSDRHR